MLTALGNDVGFDLIFSRQIIAHAQQATSRFGVSTSGGSRNVLSALAEAHARGMLTLGLAGYGGGELARADDVDALRGRRLRQRAPHPGDAGGARLRAVGTGAGAAGAPSMADAAPSDREAAVLDRIEAFRRRRPTLKDEVVTLAHGAGGKASAALVSDVFLDAFEVEPGAPFPDAATLALAGGVRLAFSTDSFVVKPLRFPGGSIGHLAVHGTVNDLAMQGAVPRWLSAAFVIEEGFPSPSCAPSLPTWRRRPSWRASQSSRGTRRSWAEERPTACSSPPPAWA